MAKTRVAIIGADGYAGEELVRLLRHHPNVELTCLTTLDNIGKTVAQVFPRYSDCSLVMVKPSVEQVIAEADLAFLALPHGVAAEYAIPLLEAGLKVIDISADFRLKNTDKYRQYYGADHPAPELLTQAVYAAPERRREEIRHTQLVACPGCYPTSITLPLCPLLEAGLIDTDGIIANAMSGVSGAGRKPVTALLFAECNESLRAYAPTGHRHLPEIEQELGISAGVEEIRINFIPHLVPVTRGIHSTIYTQPARPGLTPERVQEVWEAAYGDEPFVRVLPMGGLADTKNVVLTNTCEMGFALDTHTGRLILTAAIDNLTKGASGQAIHCMNIMLGLPETAGLLS